MGINAKSLIECPGELKCSETVVTMSRNVLYQIYVCSFSDYIFAEFVRYNCMLHFLLVMRYITSEKAHVKLSLILKLADAVVLRNEFDSTILE